MKTTSSLNKSKLIFNLAFTEDEAQRMHYALRRHADTCRKKYRQGFRLIHNPGRKPNKYVPIDKWGLPFDTSIPWVKTEYDDEMYNHEINSVKRETP